MEFKKEDILAQLDRIVSDKDFSRSKINIRLLKFLVMATLENKDVKETSIGTAFFGSKYDPIKSDNKVRVYVYHLRKKLEKYYSNAAHKGDIVFIITKGQYLVQFEEYKKTASKTSVSKLLYVIGAMATTIGVIAIFNFKAPANDFWKTLMQNDFPTTVVFGDYFTIEGTVATGNIGIIRDYEINTEQELKDYLTDNPEQDGKLKASQHHYFNWMAPYCSKSITAFWSNYDYSFDIKQISEWNVSQLGKENIVYFGQSKSMGVLKNILIENFPHYTFKSQILERTDSKTKKTTIYRDVIRYDDKITDFTVVAKITMPTGNEMRFFLSDQDCGAISALEFFTDKKEVEQFCKTHDLTEEDDFIVLFKVTGWLRKSYKMEFVLLDRKVK